MGVKVEGGSEITMMTLGFDSGKGRFTGTWIGSPMEIVWLYDGELDEDGKRLRLYSQGPSFEEGGGIANYCDVIEWVTDNERLLIASCQGKDGVWKEFMRTRYTRCAPST